MIRIVGGRWRGRRLAVPEDRSVRPTAERVREAAFNRLVHAGLDPPLEGAAFLDVFAGTGAVGLEALSRGAAKAVFIERDLAALALLRRNVGSEGAVLVRDAISPGPAPAAFDIAWLDPPWRSGLAVPALEALGRKGWLKPGALVVVESAHDDAPDLHGLIDRRRYGRTALAFLRFSPLPPNREGRDRGGAFMAAVPVLSEIPGTVFKVEVEVGDEVAEDDPLIILESMKMEIPVGAPQAGRVAEILVEEGEPVEEGQEVAVIEP